MSSRREVSLRRTAAGEFEARNVRGGVVPMGTGEGSEFTPVELLLAAIAGCSAVDVDALTARRSEPTEFAVTAAGDKLDDADGHHMGGLEVTFRVRFDGSEAGDRAREMLPRAVRQSHDRLCTVSRTVQLGADVTMRLDQEGSAELS